MEQVTRGTEPPCVLRSTTMNVTAPPWRMRSRFVSLASVAVIALATWSAGARADPVNRYRGDNEELTWMKATYPGTAKKFEQGESLLFSASSPSDVERAAKLFAEAVAEAPRSQLAARRQCQALSALGRHDDAVNACTNALVQGASGLTLRAMVGALMSGPNPATPSEVGYATLYARRLRRLMPNDPWAAAADCDIARKLGDTDMFNQCLDELERIAPEHYETKRAEAWAASWRPGWSLATAWFLIVLAGVGTVVHALVRLRDRWRAASRGKVGVAALLVLGAVAVAPRAAFADDDTTYGGTEGSKQGKRAGALSKYSIDDADPEGSIPTAEQRDGDPLEYGYLLMDLGDRADKAIARGDHLAAAKYYAALAKAVPDVAVAYRKACEQFEAAGDPDKAINYCAAALTQEGVVLADYSHYGRLVFSKKGSLQPSEIQNIDSVVAHLKENPSARNVAWDIECNLGVRLGDTKRLQECAPALAMLAPDDPKAVFYEWALAMRTKNFGEAQKLVARAKRVSKETEQVHRMERATYDAMPIWRRGFRDWRVGAMAALLISVAFAVVLMRRPSPGVSA